MSAPTRQWLERLASDGSGRGLNLIVHLGAGSGDLAGAMLATGARRVVLVEPQPGLVSGLRGICAGEPRLELRPLAIAAAAGSQPMHVLNAVQYSSLRRPTGLGALLPGLREIAQPVVDTIRLETLLEDLDPGAGGDNVLLIDTPGEEETLLDQLADLDAGLFRHVLLAGAAGALYDGSLPLADLAPRLEEMGYRVVSRDDGDPDFPVLMLERDTGAQEIRRLSEELKAATARLSRADADLAERDGRIAELEQTLAETTRAREKAGWKWGDTQKRLEEEQRLTANLEKELAEVGEAREKMRKQLAEAQDRIAALEKGGVGGNGLAEAEERVAAAQAEAALAIRMQALQDADLRDLRARYRALQEAKAAQDSLLAQLAERLTAASQYLHQIDQEAAIAAPVEKVTGPRRTRARTTPQSTAKAKTARKPAAPAATKPAAKPKTARTSARTSTKPKTARATKPAAKPKTTPAPASARTTKTSAKPASRAPRRQAQAKAKAKSDGK